MSHAKELFFPGGESKKGKWEDFLHDIYDFKESHLDESRTDGELYTVSKCGILRFYLSTDADGVSRDAYAAFWTGFLDSAAEGAEMRVSSLPPKWQEEEWE